MAEEFDIGGQGIDTQYERDYINYRPKIKYATPLIDSTFGSSVDTAGQPQLDQINDSSIISVWEDVVDVINSIDDLEKKLSDRLADVSAPVASVFLEDIKQAAEALGYQGFTDHIPFELYKLTFKTPTAPESILIQDAYEEYMSDVDGILNGELYTDVIEMKNDWEDMLSFINKGLISQIVSPEEVPKTVSKDDPNLKVIKEKEQEMMDEYANLLKLKTINREIYLALSETDYGSEDYFKAVKEYDEVSRELENIEKKLFTKAEIVDLVGRKASDTNDNIELIGNSVDFDPYKDDRYEILYNFIKGFSNKDDMTTGLKSIQVSLKLNVDVKKSTSKGMRDNLRGIAGVVNKKKINQTLINGVHLRNEVSSKVYDIMKNFDGVPGNSNFEVVANHITEGLQESENMYREQSSDFFKVHTLDTEIRNNKLATIIDKDAARSAYKMIDSILKYAQEINTTWPDQGNLSSWLNDFMEYSTTT